MLKYKVVTLPELRREHPEVDRITHYNIAEFTQLCDINAPSGWKLFQIIPGAPLCIIYKQKTWFYAYNCLFGRRSA